MLQIRFYADSASPAELPAMADQLTRYHLGSLDLGARMAGPNLVRPSAEQVANTIAQLQKTSKLPLLVGGDLERGLASRLSSVPDLPTPMALGAIGDPQMVERVSALTAKEARAVGMEWAFAPVADINSNPDNPIINTRSFGDDPAAVAKLVAAYVRGAHSAAKGEDRMAVAVKHFPGEGDTAEDPHTRVTKITADVEHLRRVELLPFRAAITAGADSVMLAQAAVPALDADTSKVATTSAPVVETLLRKEAGFQGLVITDALEMKGLTDLYPKDDNPSGRIAVDAIKAGADVLTLPRDLDATYKAILAAVKSGEIPESRIDASVTRILELKASLGLFENRTFDLERAKGISANKEDFDFAQQVADAAVTLVRSNGIVLPLAPEQQGSSTAQSEPPTKKSRVIVVTFTDSGRSPLGKAFDREMMVRNPNTRIFHFYNDRIGSVASAGAVIPFMSGADKIVLAAFTTHVAGRQLSVDGKVVSAVGFAGATAQAFGELLAVMPDKTAVVALGSPYLIQAFPKIANYICTYSLASTSEIAAAKALYGEIQNTASLPVNLPGIATRGTHLPWPKPAAVPTQAMAH